MKLQSTFLLFATLLGVSYGQETIFSRKCPKRPVEKNFDLIKYTSKPWFDVMRYNVNPKYIPEGCECGFTKYKKQCDNSIAMKFCCRQINKGIKTECKIGEAIYSFPEVAPLEGKLNASFDGRPTNKSNYWVLSTDYDNYSIIHYCQNIEGNRSSETFWLLSRTPILNLYVKEKTDELIDKYFDRSLMVVTEQSPWKCENPDYF